MKERRQPTRQHIIVRLDGSVWDEAAYHAYLAWLDSKAPKRVTVERLSRKAAA